MTRHAVTTESATETTHAVAASRPCAEGDVATDVAATAAPTARRRAGATNMTPTGGSRVTATPSPATVAAAAQVRRTMSVRSSFEKGAASRHALGSCEVRRSLGYGPTIEDVAAVLPMPRQRAWSALLSRAHTWRIAEHQAAARLIAGPTKDWFERWTLVEALLDSDPAVVRSRLAVIELRFVKKVIGYEHDLVVAGRRPSHPRNHQLRCVLSDRFEQNAFRLLADHAALTAHLRSIDPTTAPR